MLQVVAGSQADRFEIRQGADAGSVDVRVTDVATERLEANIIGLDVEFFKIEAGGGDDVFDVVAAAIGHSLFGEDGDDRVTEQIGLNFQEIDLSFISGGPGHDKVNLESDSASEHYGITPVRDQAVPDPHVQVTDLATGVVIGDFFVQQTEEIAIASGGGEDHLDVQWDAAQMSGLTALFADLGDGNDTMTASLLPVLVAPDEAVVQTAVFDVDAGRGDDQITFRHAAGSWFDVAFTARLGSGRDRSQAVLLPPPDDGVPGPEGMRRLQFDVAAGKEGDVVAVQNGTGREFFEVFVVADFGVGDDLLEAAGEMSLAARPGRGSDTARVTRNLLPFVAEFERVEVLEEVP